MSETVSIGVIGGSGLYQMPEITDISHIDIDTPFGKPSSVVIGTLRGKRVAFLPRHGEGHVYSPTAIPQRANIYALKSIGVRYLIAVNACGSLREDYEPGHVVVPDQIFDYTLNRDNRSFFNDGLVAHVSVADPFCPELSAHLAEAVTTVGGTCHPKGTFIIEDGPRFATRAESKIFRSWGCDLIGMTTAPEAFLAREAEMAYATMAHITDYDVWHDEPVTVEMVMKTFNNNIVLAQKAVAHAVESLNVDQQCSCHTALDNTIMTAPDKRDPATIKKLYPLIRRVLRLQDVT